MTKKKKGAEPATNGEGERDDLDDVGNSATPEATAPDGADALVKKPMTWAEAAAEFKDAVAGEEPPYEVRSTYERAFEVPATDHEIREAAEASVRLRNEAEVIDEKRKFTTKQLKEQAAAKRTEAAPFDSTVAKGTKWANEPVEVRRVLRQNADFVVRVSTGEVLETRPLSARDIDEENEKRQLGIEQAIAKSDAAPAPAPEPTTGIGDEVVDGPDVRDSDFDDAGAGA
jgi:hypothetical protein